jgi:putative heme-binding domain-containing protein
VKTRFLGFAVAVFASASLLSAQSPVMQDHPETYPRVDIEHGARLYAERCDMCHGPNGDGVNGVNLKSGKFRNATTDQQLGRFVTSGSPTAGMPAINLDAADLAGLIAYLRNMNSVDRGSIKPGNPERGRTLVESKGACLTCHRINNTGSRKAPNLSEIGATRSAGSIERSIVDPDSQMWPINRPVLIVTKDGKTIDGRRVNEDTYTVQIADESGRLMSLNKSDLRRIDVATKSTMPSYEGKLTPDELADVVTYLLTLKGL